MQEQEKYIKETCSYIWGWGANGKFTSTKKILDNGKFRKNLVTSTVDKELIFKNKSKAKDKEKSNLDGESEHFNFETIVIGP